MSEELVKEEELENDDLELEGDSEESEDDGYTPDLTYKVKDEVKEFDPRFHDLIKSKEDEDYIRDLYTKSEGLDSYKQKVAERDTSIAQRDEQIGLLTKGYQDIKAYRDAKKLDDLFHALGMEKEDVMEWAYSQAELKEKPEEYQNLYTENETLKRQMNELNSRVSDFESRSQDQRVQDDLNQLNSLVDSESYRPVAEAMKVRGLDLTEEVVKAGIYEFQVTGKEPAIPDVVNTIAQRYSYLINQNPPSGHQSPEEGEAAPTIPKVKGSAGAPVKKGINSLAELRKLADAIES